MLHFEWILCNFRYDIHHMHFKFPRLSTMIPKSFDLYTKHLNYKDFHFYFYFKFHWNILVDSFNEILRLFFGQFFSFQCGFKLFIFKFIFFWFHFRFENLTWRCRLECKYNRNKHFYFFLNCSHPIWANLSFFFSFVLLNIKLIYSMFAFQSIFFECTLVIVD